jgi:hypothetical protein
MPGLESANALGAFSGLGNGRTTSSQPKSGTPAGLVTNARGRGSSNPQKRDLLEAREMNRTGVTVRAILAAKPKAWLFAPQPQERIPGPSLAR